MTKLMNLLLRCAESAVFRLRRRQRHASLRGSPAANAGLDDFGTHELLRFLRPVAPRVIYDIGANRGQWTLLAKSVFPEAVVHAFEPVPEHRDAYLRNTGGLRDVYLHPVALGERAIELEMDLTTFSDSASLLRPTALMEQTYAVRPGAKLRVPVVRLDEWTAAHRLGAPDLIKLDVQGYELAALCGAPAALRCAAAVLLEVSFREYYRDQPLAGAVIAFLERAGFELAALSPDIRAGQALSQADALFVRR